MFLVDTIFYRYEGLSKNDRCHVRGVFTYKNGDRYGSVWLCACVCLGEGVSEQKVISPHDNVP